MTCRTRVGPMAFLVSNETAATAYCCYYEGRLSNGVSGVYEEAMERRTEKGEERNYRCSLLARELPVASTEFVAS